MKTELKVFTFESSCSIDIHKISSGFAVCAHPACTCEPPRSFDLGSAILVSISKILALRGLGFLFFQSADGRQCLIIVSIEDRRLLKK
jgi:hypothetical protein